MRTAIFELLETRIAPDVNKGTGRRGMSLWAIFVLGVLRLDLDIDYDRLQELANKHIDVRAMLGHGPFNEGYYHYQTLVDNVALFTPELLEAINQHVVTAGHVLLKKRKRSAVACLTKRNVTRAKNHIRAGQFPSDKLSFQISKQLFTRALITPLVLAPKMNI